MPNRIIKESITTSENLNNLTADEESLFVRLTVKVDDFGRYDARPAVIRAACYPLKLDKVKEKDVERWLISLEREKLISIYWHNNKPYLYLTTWQDHQRVRSTKSKYPEPTADNCGHLHANDSNLQQNAPVNVNVNVNEIGNVNGSGQKHGKHVSLTPDEYDGLVKAHGEQVVEDYIERVNDYVSSKGKKYKDYAATIRNWIRKDQEKSQQNKASPKTKTEKVLEFVNSYGGDSP